MIELYIVELFMIGLSREGCVSIAVSFVLKFGLAEIMSWEYVAHSQSSFQNSLQGLVSPKTFICTILYFFKMFVFEVANVKNSIKTCEDGENETESISESEKLSSPHVSEVTRVVSTTHITVQSNGGINQTGGELQDTATDHTNSTTNSPSKVHDTPMTRDATLEGQVHATTIKPSVADNADADITNPSSAQMYEDNPTTKPSESGDANLYLTTPSSKQLDANNITNQPSETKDINSDPTELTSALSDVNTPPTKVAIEETLTNEGAKTGGLGNQNSKDSLEVTSANEIGEDGQDTVTTEEPIDEGLLTYNLILQKLTSSDWLAGSLCWNLGHFGY